MLFNENGEVVLKVDVVLEQLIPYLEEIKSMMYERAKWKSQPNYVQMVKTKLSFILSEFETMSNDDALHLGADKLRQIKREYLHLINKINDYGVAFCPSKINFCNYASISMDAYNIMMKDGSEEQKLEIREIDNLIVDSMLTSAQTGSQKENTTQFSLTAKGVGHSIQKTSPIGDALENLAQTQMTNAFYAKALEDLERVKIDAPKK